MQETRVLVETRGTTGEETISYWFDLPIDVAEFEEKLGIGAESGDYRIIEKVLPYADEVHEHTSVYQLNELDFMYRQLSSDMQEEYVSLLTVFKNLEGSKSEEYVNNAIYNSFDIYFKNIDFTPFKEEIDVKKIYQMMLWLSEGCIFRKNRALAPHERSAVPLGTDHCPVG